MVGVGKDVGMGALRGVAVICCLFFVVCCRAPSKSGGGGGGHDGAVVAVGDGGQAGGGVAETGRPIGQIVAVRPESGFVIIRGLGGASLPAGIGAGSFLRTGDGAGGGGVRVRLSPERKGGFHCADYVEGVPAVGEFVYADGAAAEGDLSGDPFGR